MVYAHFEIYLLYSLFIWFEGLYFYTDSIHFVISRAWFSNIDFFDNIWDILRVGDRTTCGQFIILSCLLPSVGWKCIFFIQYLFDLVKFICRCKNCLAINALKLQFLFCMIIGWTALYYEFRNNCMDDFKSVYIFYAKLRYYVTKLLLFVNVK